MTENQKAPAVKLLEVARQWSSLEGNDLALAVGEKLIDIYPFAEWKGKRIYQGNGAIHAQFFIGFWVIELMKEGALPSAIIDEAIQIIEVDEADFFHIIIIIGLNVDNKVRLGSEVELWPWKDVPLLHGSEQVTYNETQIVQRHGLSQYELDNNIPRCAAVRRFSAKPLLVGGDEDCDKRYERDRVEKEEFRDNIKTSLIMSSWRSVRFASEIYVPVCKWIPIRNLGSMFSEYQVGLSGDSQTDLDVMISFYKKLVDFKEQRVIHRVAERIARARETNRSFTKAIDFGIALEILLMHKESGGNSEITNKIQMRAGWLLGVDFASRKSGQM